jgi:ribosomal-protein-alanine N-acetyltransferase
LQDPANPSPALGKGRILIRPYISADQQAFIRFMTDPEVNYYMDNNILSADEAEELFEKIHHIYARHPGKPFYIWAVEYKGQCAGHLELKETEFTANGELEVVYLLDKDFWGRGIMLEALPEILRFAAGLDQQVIATVDKGNGRSLRLLEKLGIQMMSELKTDNKVWKVRLQAHH